MKPDIRRWAAEGISAGADRMIVASDDFSSEYFPVFASDSEFDSKLAEVRSVNMQRAIEVYDLRGDLEEQLELPHVWRIPETSEAFTLEEALEAAMKDPKMALVDTLAALVEEMIPQLPEEVRDKYREVLAFVRFTSEFIEEVEG